MFLGITALAEIKWAPNCGDLQLDPLMQGLFTVLNLMDVFPLSVLIPEDLSMNEAWWWGGEMGTHRLTVWGKISRKKSLIKKTPTIYLFIRLRPRGLQLFSKHTGQSSSPKTTVRLEREFIIMSETRGMETISRAMQLLWGQHVSLKGTKKTSGSAVTLC